MCPPVQSADTQVAPTGVQQAAPPSKMGGGFALVLPT